MNSHRRELPSTRSPKLCLGMSRFSTAASASTIASDDMSRTNVETDVTGMFKIGLKTWPVAGSFQTSCGNGPVRLRPLYIRYVEMSDAKSMHSDPMNAQIAIFRLGSPVVV